MEADPSQRFAALYDDLHRLARVQVRRNGARDSLGTTTLLHEAFLELSQRADFGAAGREAMLAYAARAMRGLVIDQLRRNQAQKRGGGVAMTVLDTELGDALGAPPDAGSLDDAMAQLAGAEPALAELVDLKFFCGFSFAEIAAQRQVSERTVQRQWQKARAYLYAALRASG